MNIGFVSYQVQDIYFSVTYTKSAELISDAVCKIYTESSEKPV